METIYNILTSWTEKHYGSSDGETNGTNVVRSCMTKEDAENKFKIEKNKTIRALKEELKSMMYPFKNKWLEVMEDNNNNFSIVYDNKNVRLTYNLSISESKVA